MAVTRRVNLGRKKKKGGGGLETGPSRRPKTTPRKSPLAEARALSIALQKQNNILSGKNARSSTNRK